MKHPDDPARPEHGLTRTALRASGRADILFFLLVSTVASTAGIQAWQTLINNFAVESAHLSADGIGFVQSIREVPGFLSMLVIYVLFIFSEQRAASLAILILGLGLAVTGFFPSFWGLTITTLIMVAFPDPSTFQLVAWRPSDRPVARLFCDVKNPDGTPFAAD